MNTTANTTTANTAKPLAKPLSTAPCDPSVPDSRAYHFLLKEFINGAIALDATESNLSDADHRHLATVIDAAFGCTLDEYLTAFYNGTTSSGRYIDCMDYDYDDDDDESMGRDNFVDARYNDDDYQWR